MPRFLSNWKFDEVVSFLKQHFFVDKPSGQTGHRYFKGYVGLRIRIVEVQFHSNKPISPKSLQHDIIPKSGIPEIYWKKWAVAGNKRLRKRIQYTKAAEIPKSK